MIRLFVGLALPEDIRFRLAGLCAGVPGARWVASESMHLTLRFVGEVDGGMFEDLAQSLDRIRRPAFPLSLTGVGQFGDGGKTRMLWAGVERSAPLLALQEAVENATRRAGLEPEGRKFVPHVTLARCRDASRVEPFLQMHGLFRAGPFTVDRFTLFSSFLSRSGALYRPEAEFPLEGGGAWEEDEDARAGSEG